MATTSDTIHASQARAWSRPRVRAALGVPLVAGVIVLAIRLWLKWVGPFPGDEWALHHLEGRALPRSIGDLGTFFSVIGTPTVAALTLLAVLPIVLRSEGARGAGFVVAAGSGVFFNMLLKWLSGPTPLMLERYPDVASQGLNYPSGHTVYGVVFFGSLAWLAWRRRRLDIVLPLLALIGAMGPFRVIVDAHFVSDVVAAYLVGFAWLVPVAILCGVDAGRRDPPTAGLPRLVAGPGSSWAPFVVNSDVFGAHVALGQRSRSSWAPIVVNSDVFGAHVALGRRRRSSWAPFASISDVFGAHVVLGRRSRSSWAPFASISDVFGAHVASARRPRSSWAPFASISDVFGAHVSAGPEPTSPPARSPRLRRPAEPAPFGPSEPPDTLARCNFLRLTVLRQACHHASPPS